MKKRRPKPKPCTHPRCGNPEWHHAQPGGGFSSECDPFKLNATECECREPARYGTIAAPDCFVCKGTGYINWEKHLKNIEDMKWD